MPHCPDAGKSFFFLRHQRKKRLNLWSEKKNITINFSGVHKGPTNFNRERERERKSKVSNTFWPNEQGAKSANADENSNSHVGVLDGEKGRGKRVVGEERREKMKQRLHSKSRDEAFSRFALRKKSFAILTEELNLKIKQERRGTKKTVLTI